MRFFFYGTLRDPDVRALVLATQVEHSHVRPALLHGYRRIAVAGAHYPTLRRAVGGVVEGEIVSGLGRADAIRIFHFEGGSYELAEQPVRLIGGGTKPAWICLARGRVPGGGVWDLALWQRSQKRRFMGVANRWMREFGVRTLACHYPIRHLRDMAPEVEMEPGRERRRMGRR